MAYNVVATNAGDLSLINEIIHDYWFKVDEIVSDPKENTLTLRFTRPRFDRERAGSLFSALRSGEPQVESFLRVHDVLGWQIDDRERIDSYDFNEVKYDSGTSMLYITTGVPIAIGVEVARLKVCVEITDTVVKARR